MSFYGFQVYGDNIGECFHLCEIIKKNSKQFGVDFLAYVGLNDRPVFRFRYNHIEFGLLPCGRYKNWKKERRPYIGYEDPNIIICYMRKPQELGLPILGIEFNDAVEVGNNAWQRFPRVIQSAEKGVPFIYQVPICGAEVKNGEIKSTRHPNVIIQIAQIILMAKYRTFSLTIYKESPWYKNCIQDGTASRQINGLKGEETLAGFTISIILREIFKNSTLWLKPIYIVFKVSMKKMLCQISNFIEGDFTILSDHSVFSEANFDKIIDIWWNWLIYGREIPNEFRFFDWKKEMFLCAPVPFLKATSTKSLYKSKISPKISFRKSMRKQEMPSFLKEWYPPTDFVFPDLSDSLKRGIIPLSYKKEANEISFVFNPKHLSIIFKNTYPNLDSKILDKISKAEATIFFPLAGYVMNTGGPAFSRPDKGCTGLMRIVFPRSNLFEEVIVLLFSQLIPENWRDQILKALKEKETDSITSQTNNLWRELVRYATIIISDKHEEGIII